MFLPKPCLGLIPNRRLKQPSNPSIAIFGIESPPSNRRPTKNAQAQIDLIAIGKVSGKYQDMAIKTASSLESGVAGNMLGGVGSGLAYAGSNTFLALPDRGPNATPYN